MRILRFIIRFPSQLPGILASYRAEIKSAEALDLGKMPDREVMGQVRQLVFGAGRRFMNYDFMIIAVIHITYQMLGTLLDRYFGDESEQVRSELVSGVTGNVTMETNKRIWDLAQKAKASPTDSAAARRLSGSELRTELERTADGRELIAALNQFLQEYRSSRGPDGHSLSDLE